MQEYAEHALRSAIQGVAVAVGFLLVIVIVRRFHPGLASDMLGAGQNHP